MCTTHWITVASNVYFPLTPLHCSSIFHGSNKSHLTCTAAVLPDALHVWCMRYMWYMQYMQYKHCVCKVNAICTRMNAVSCSRGCSSYSHQTFLILNTEALIIRTSLLGQCSLQCSTAPATVANRRRFYLKIAQPPWPYRTLWASTSSEISPPLFQPCSLNWCLFKRGDV